jgi:hypothetical protein
MVVALDHKSGGPSVRANNSGGRALKATSFICVNIILAVLGLNAFPLGIARAAADSGSIIYVPGSTNKDLQTAISEVLNDGVIEIATGTYATPSTGFSAANLTKSFTIRAAAGATVALSGGGSRRIFDIRNSPSNLQGGIIFEGITFAGGYSNPGLVNAISIDHSNVTFVDCIFQDQVNGAVLVRNGSTVFFDNDIWRNNLTWNDNGAAFEIWDSTAYIHGSQFINNQNNATTTSSVPLGGAIYAVNAMMRITNSRFDSNKSGGHGGGIYVIGLWSGSGSNVIIANSTFVNNQIVRPSDYSLPIEGGALNVEDQTTMRIYNSRFVTNSAQIGGGINVFRAKLEIYNSVFQGNRATDTRTTSGFGGAINFNYHDRPDFASLLVEDTLIQGRYGSVTTVALSGGGLNTLGITTANRPQAVLRRVVFNDLDTWQGSAIATTGASLSLEDSLVMNCDASKTGGGIGGGVLVYPGGLANISNTYFAFNSADQWGGAFFAQGAQFNITNSTFYRNKINLPANQSYGAAIFTAPVENQAMVSGVVAGSTFVEHTGLAIFDDDRSIASSYNAVVYNSNRFYEPAGYVYRDSLAATVNPGGLNALVVNRSGGAPSTDKSVLDNQTLSSTPVISRLLAVPTAVLSSAAAGDAGTNPPAYLAYVWNGASASLDGSALSTAASIQSTTTSGTHTLTVNGANNSLQLAAGPAPIISTSLSSINGATNLNWDVTAGTFQAIGSDQGLPVATKSGTLALPSTQRIYRLHATTQQGGAIQAVDPRSPLLSAVDRVPVLVGLNQTIMRGQIPIANVGGLTLTWSAQTTTPNLIQLEATGGTITSSGAIPFRVIVSQPGTYSAYVNIDAGVAGSKQVLVALTVVAVVQGVYLPLIVR